MFVKSRISSFKYAFHGLKYLLITQKNAQIHLFITVMVIILSMVLRLPSIEWAAIILVIGLVWAAEAFNTAIELTVNLASPTFHPLAKAAKDVGAAAVLITAITAIMIALVIFGPHILSIFRS